MKVLFGSGSKALGKKVGDLDKFEVLNANITRFADGESRVEINCNNLSQESILIVQSTNKDEYIIELILIIDALKRLGATDIHLFVPYFGYSRADRIVQAGSAIGAKAIANTIKNDIKSLFVVDIHFAQFEGFFDFPVYNLHTEDLFAKHLKKSFANDFLKDIAIVAPDLGCAKKSRSFAKVFECDVVIINKHRPAVSVCQITDVIGDTSGKNCIIIDDIICGGGTLCGAAEKLKSMGAKSVVAMITHGVLSGDALSKIEKSQIEKLVITDTIEKEVDCEKLAIASVGQMVVDKIRELDFIECKKR